MILTKTIKDKVEVEYFFIQGVLDLDSNYFINEIDKGIKEKNNQNFKTNVRGLMTSWQYFTHNDHFLKAILPIFDYLDTMEKIKRYYLESAWGLKESFTHYTIEHDHAPNYFSGIIYLNSHPQTLLFPQIKIEYKPRKNSFLIFSSFLEHKTIRNISKKDKYALSFNINKHVY
tara:strand:+ start:79 stop:597 length:519 start_codon:yes stop_codon:yes gene_type:complete